MTLDMGNALLYAFSTIPQTVGAAFGVLAAFVLYRFQVNNSVIAADQIVLEELLDTRMPGRGATSDRQQGYEYLSHGQVEEFLKLVERSGLPPENSKQHLAYRRFKAMVENRPRVNRILRIAFTATSVVIMYSLVILWCEPWLETRVNAVAHIALALGLYGVFFCLKLYWDLIQFLLASP